jgi:hypothetical protein
VKILLKRVLAKAFWRHLFWAVSGLIEQTILVVFFLFEVQYKKTR